MISLQMLHLWTLMHWRHQETPKLRKLSMLRKLSLLRKLNSLLKRRRLRRQNRRPFSSHQSKSCLQAP